MKKALILGINGQDGSYLADILLENGYEVHGLVRRNSQPNLWRIEHCLDRLTIHQGDVTDSICLQKLIEAVQPDEIYNEADQDHVGFSFASPKLSVDVTCGAVASLLEIIKGSKIKLFQPLSATMFGNAVAPQTLETPFSPQSPYACAKVAAYYLCKHYREKYGVFVSTAILYNHDSIRRQGDYLLHKICKTAVEIKKGNKEHLMLSNPLMQVDIGYAKEYMEGATKLLQLDQPTDILLGIGYGASINSLVTAAFDVVDIPFSKFKEVMWETKHNIPQSSLIPEMHRTIKLLGGWSPTKTTFEIVEELCEFYGAKL